MYKCSECGHKYKRKTIELTKEKQGQIAIIDGERAVFAQTGCELFAFISLRDGNRWFDPLKLKELEIKLNKEYVTRFKWES